MIRRLATSCVSLAVLGSLSLGVTALADELVYDVEEGKASVAQLEEVQLGHQASDAPALPAGDDALKGAAVLTDDPSQLPEVQHALAPQVVDGWQLNGGSWNYVVQGQLQHGWLLLGDTWYYFNNDGRIHEAIDRMYHGINGCTFNDVADSLRTRDPYMVLADYDSYRNAQNYITECYNDKLKWAKMSLNNIAGAGIFSADRAVTEYAENIWNL